MTTPLTDTKWSELRVGLNKELQLQQQFLFWTQNKLS